MRLLLKSLGYVLLVLSASFAAVYLAQLAETQGQNSLPTLARLYGLAAVGAGGYLLWRAGDRRPVPALRNPAWHLVALLAGTILAVLAGALFGLALASVVSNAGQPEADPSTWGLLFFFGGTVLGGAMLARVEYGRFGLARRKVMEMRAALPGLDHPAAYRWERLWGWLRLAASLLLSLVMLQQGMALLERAQTTNGMDIGAQTAGVLARLILPLDALVFLTAALTLAWLLGIARVSDVLAGSLSFVIGLAGIVLALLASAAFHIGSVFLLPATLLFVLAYLASLIDYARSYPSIAPV
jgi:hypothetical protein